MRVRDSQRSKLYTWERQTGIVRDAEMWVAMEPRPGAKVRRRTRKIAMPFMLSMDECRFLVCRILRDYGSNPATMHLNIGDGRRSRNAHANAYHMALPRWAQGVEVVCHETAHMLMHRAGDNEYFAAHGPEFARLFINLLARYGGYKRGELVASARAAGVKVVRSYGGQW